jgi:GNAT superfamily N-acetyltransferase
MRINEISVPQYKEIEFVCANAEHPDATDPAVQRKLYAELQKIPGVIPLYQDWTEYSEGQYSLSAIYKDRAVRGKILSLAQQLGVEVDLEQTVDGDYVDRALTGGHEGQITEQQSSALQFNVQPVDNFKTGFEITLTVHGKHVGRFAFVRNESDDVNNEADVETRWQGQGYGKLLLMKAIDVANSHGLDFQEDIRGVTDAQQNVYDSLTNAGLIVSPGDGFWFLTPEGEQELANASNS